MLFIPLQACMHVYACIHTHVGDPVCAPGCLRRPPVCLHRASPVGGTRDGPQRPADTKRHRIGFVYTVFELDRCCIRFDHWIQLLGCRAAGVAGAARRGQEGLRGFCFRVSCRARMRVGLTGMGWDEGDGEGGWEWWLAGLRNRRHP